MKIYKEYSPENLESLYIIDLDLFFDEGYKQITRADSSVVFIYAHCLDSFRHLIKFLIGSNGFLNRNIFVLPKKYSAIKPVVKKLEAMGITVLPHDFEFKIGDFDRAAMRNIRNGCSSVKSYCDKKVGQTKDKLRLILVDDGGLLTRTWYQEYGDKTGFDVISIQQTASGAHEPPNISRIPKIDVARSAAKRWFESKIIATGVTRKAISLDVLGTGKTIGVAGYGAVGKALARELSNRGERTVIHDISGLPVKRGPFFGVEKRQRDFLKNSDVIFGCVGRNWLNPGNLYDAEGEKHLISCSSRDIEFRSVLTEQNWPAGGSDFSDLEFYRDGKTTIYNGGFPINFDRVQEYETLEEIVLTRSLILSAIVQSLFIKTGRIFRRPLKLSARVQRKVIETWLTELNKIDKLQEFGVSKSQFDDYTWWLNESTGDRYLDI